MMTPKSLLRHKLAVSSSPDFTGESHFKRIVLTSAGRRKARRRGSYCALGKLAYELMEARDNAEDQGVRDVRLEQLCPFPSEPVGQAPEGHAALEAAGWGPGRAAEPGRLVLPRPGGSSAVTRGSRSEAAAGALCGAPGLGASPATGLAKRHAAEQAALIADALPAIAAASRTRPSPRQ